MKKHILILIATLAFTATSARASGINWGNNAFGQVQTGTDGSGNPIYTTEPLYNSTGGLLDNSFTFELGTWNTGFTPTTANVTSWASNWNVLSTASSTSSPLTWLSLDPGSSGVNDPNQNYQFFQSSASFNTNGTVQPGGHVFQTGQQVYLWAFNSQAAVATSEWALVTDVNGAGSPSNAWTVPDPTNTVAQPVTWSLYDADTAVFGALNGVTGAGNQSVAPSGPYALQTYNLIGVVPEPGSALLVLLAGVAFRLRRRARAS